mgnify:CR=1 FL=1
MGKYFVFVLVAVSSSFVFAKDKNLVPWGGDESGQWYLIEDSKEFNDGVAKAWFVHDLKEAKSIGDGGFYKSIRIQYEYNCKEYSQKTIRIKAYTEAMGFGYELEDEYVGDYTMPVFYREDDWNGLGFSGFCRKIWEFWR